MQTELHFVESKWFYENGKWNIVSTKVLEKAKLKKRNKFKGAN